MTIHRFWAGAAFALVLSACASTPDSPFSKDAEAGEEIVELAEDWKDGKAMLEDGRDDLKKAERRLKKASSDLEDARKRVTRAERDLKDAQEAVQADRLLAARTADDLQTISPDPERTQALVKAQSDARKDLKTARDRAEDAREKVSNAQRRVERARERMERGEAKMERATREYRRS
ncbi:MAG: hypothetical protein WBG08_10955 [Litorimonas sp.]